MKTFKKIWTVFIITVVFVFSYAFLMYTIFGAFLFQLQVILVLGTIGLGLLAYYFYSDWDFNRLTTVN